MPTMGLPIDPIEISIFIMRLSADKVTRVSELSERDQLFAVSVLILSREINHQSARETRHKI